MATVALPRNTAEKSRPVRQYDNYFFLLRWSTEAKV